MYNILRKAVKLKPTQFNLTLIECDRWDFATNLSLGAWL